jgi:hypothetical protein
MESLSKHQIAMASYHWGADDRRARVQLYTDRPQCRPLFLEDLDTSFWPELVKLDHHILNRGDERFKILSRILNTLPTENAITAFHEMQQHSTRKAVMENLKPDSRERVEAALTQVSVKRMEEFRNDPQDEKHIMATKGFLQTLNDSARTCSGKRCIGSKVDLHKDYTVFSVAPCLKHSFHLACIERDHDCGANPLNSEREREGR